jgi:hypothetical protein
VLYSQHPRPDAFVEEGSIANNISALRKILSPHFEGEGPIATIAKRGYRFTATVTVGNAVPEAAAATAAVPVTPSATPRRPRRWPTWPVALAVTAALVVAGHRLGPRHQGLATVRPVRVGPPIGRRPGIEEPMRPGGARRFSTALTETIGAELMAGAQFRTVSGENVLRMPRELALGQFDEAAQSWMPRCSCRGVSISPV